MRRRIHRQGRITPPVVDHEHARELTEMSAILDELEGRDDLLERVASDLCGVARRDTGRKGMTAEQVMRVVIVKQMTGYSYEELAFVGASRQRGEKAPSRQHEAAFGRAIWR